MTAAGWEKGQIEKNVRDARHRIWHQAPAFKTLEALNDWLAQRCQALWQTLRHPEYPDRTLAEILAEEREHLMPVPVPFDGFVEQTKRVSSTCLITFERNRYSVPAAFANRPVSLHVYADELVIVAEGNAVARHRRVFNREHDQGQTIYDWRHYLAVVQRKPGALRNGAPFTQLPDSFKRLQSTLLKRPGGDREMADILALVLHHDEHQVEQAIELALSGGAVSKQQVINCLMRLLAPPKPPRLRTPPALKLVNEPQANTQRYDHLRGKRHAS